MKDTILHTLWDVFESKTINIKRGELKSQAKSLGISSNGISHLVGGRQLSIADRYILPKNKHLIFNLIDYNTQEKFSCISNKSIFIQLDHPYTDNEGKYIYGLRAKRQKFASVCGRVFYLEGCVSESDYPSAKMSVSLTKIDKIRDLNKIRQKMAHSLRGRMWKELKKQLIEKQESAFDLAGCDIDFLMKHLESQFADGMTWENYGKWHIDHIKPISVFDLFSESQRRECCHYSNLQPLWARDNLAKHNKYPIT